MYFYSLIFMITWQTTFFSKSVLIWCLLHLCLTQFLRFFLSYIDNFIGLILPSGLIFCIINVACNNLTKNHRLQQWYKVIKHDWRTCLVPQLQPEALRPARSGLPGETQSAAGPGGHCEAGHCWRPWGYNTDRKQV